MKRIRYTGDNPEDVILWLQDNNVDYHYYSTDSGPVLEIYYDLHFLKVRSGDYIVLEDGDMVFVVPDYVFDEFYAELQPWPVRFIKKLFGG